MSINTPQATAAASPQTATTSATAAAVSAPTPTLAREHTHEHAWVTASKHATSEGWIAYVSCAGCGTWRVERLGAERGDRAPLSR